MNKNEIAIVLQGYSTSKHALAEILSNITQQGYENIIVSTYSICMPEEDTVIDRSNYILNDKYESGEEYMDGPSALYTQKRPTELTISTLFPFPDIGYYPNDSGLQGKSNNTNFQLITTQRGIKKVYEKYPNVKYIFKVRADLDLYDLDIFFKHALERIHISRGSNLYFESKILGQLNNNIGVQKWLNDFYFFGTKVDMFNLFNIPYLQTDKKSPEEYICHTYIKSQTTETVDWVKDLSKYFDYNPHYYPFDPYYDLKSKWLKNN